MSTRVLIIDPDINFIVNIKQALEGTGEFEVSLSANGVAAADTLQGQLHDLVLIAFDVPDMDVMELLALLRHVQSKIAVILCPQTEAEQARVRLMDVQGAINKPYVARDLIPYLRSVLARHAPPPSSPVKRDQQGDEFVPPEMPPSVQQFIQSVEPPEGKPSPTELPDRVDVDKVPPRTPPPSHEPESARFLEELEAMEDIYQGRYEDAGDAGDDVSGLGGTRLLDDDEEELRPTTQLLSWDDVDQTATLPGTDPLDEFPLPDDDDVLYEHGWVDKRQTSEEHEAVLLPDFGDEPPTDVEDTPTIPAHDLDSVRQFIATTQDPAPEEFGDVLDAVAHSPLPEERQRSPQDRAFHDLVDSMRVPETSRAGLSGLEDLLESIARDAAYDLDQHGEDADSTLDYVLDAIRRVTPPPTDYSDDDDEVADDAPDDTDETIGSVINNLFDPSFQGVLDALDGEEIDENAYTEPTYSTTAQEGSQDGIGPAREDQITFEELDELAAAEDAPDWLAGYEAEDIEPPLTLPEAPGSSLPGPAGPVIDEPPMTKEDSSSYPATAALSAVTGDADDEFSLDDLLSQIEGQLPATRRPQLRPLPSWEKEAQEELAQEDARRMAALFDHIEGESEEAPPPVPPDIPLPEHIAPPPEPRVDTQATPVLPPRDADDVPSSEVVQEIDTEPSEPVLDLPPASTDTDWETTEVLVQHTDSAADFELPLSPGEDALAGLLDTDTGDEVVEHSLADLLAMVDLPPDELPPEDVIQDEEFAPPDEEATERFGLELPPEEEPHYAADDAADEPYTFERASVEEDADIYAPGATDAGDMAFVAFDDDAPDGASYEDDQQREADEAAAVALEELFEAEEFTPDEAAPAITDFAFPPDDDHLIPMPVDVAARLFGGELDEDDIQDEDPDDEDEDALLAQVAVQLTQFSLESSAQATMLSSPGQRLADAGDLPDVAMTRLFEIVDHAWHAATVDSDSLIRFISLPEAGEFLLYSMVVEDDLILSMVFNANTPVRTIRRQATRLSESLAFVPDGEGDDAIADDAPEAAAEFAGADMAGKDPAGADMAPEPAAAETLPSRPTDMRPPEGLADALDDYPEAAEAAGAQPAEASIPLRPRPDVPYLDYTCLWLLHDPRKELSSELIDALHDWIHEIASENAWDVDALDVQPDYVTLTLGIPQNTTPDGVIMKLMDETTARTRDRYDVGGNGDSLWVDGYYMVAPSRPLTDREISRFITYQRQYN
ncbi:MAG: response regulator [Chloroflexi bacterium]|nr:response regulator [Chloroflexota bacterium]